MLRIDKELCIGCGICEEHCPFGAVEVVDGLAVVGENCNLCGACIESCDVEAMTIDKGEAAKEKDDLDSYSGIWVFCEYTRGTLAPVATELLGIGRTLADDRKVPLTAVLLGYKTAESGEKLIGLLPEPVTEQDLPGDPQCQCELYDEARRWLDAHDPCAGAADHESHEHEHGLVPDP